MSSSPPATQNTELHCRRLPGIEPENWDAVFEAFSDLPFCDYRQHWREKPQSRFMPGRVRVGWSDEAMWILAEFEDVDIFNAATKWNQDAYLLGDVFEIFLQPQSQALASETYFEFHITPENQRLQLQWPCVKYISIDGEICASPQWISRTLNDSRFESWTRVEQTENRWQALARIPFGKLNWSTPGAGDAWRFSFGRYDYTRNESAPVLSSSSLHLKSDFHRIEEWGYLIFC